MTKEKIEIIIKGLREIERGEGAFNRNLQEHANNVIENNKRIANDLLIIVLEESVIENND